MLLSAREPLTPKEILDRAYLAGFVPAHLHGGTQHKTLQARLSEDISQYLENSRFCRTTPGRFFLRSLRDDPHIPDAFKTLHFAPPRRKELKREAILAIDADCLATGHSSEKVEFKHIERCLSEHRYSYAHWHKLRAAPDQLPVHSFVIVHRHGKVLSFRCGKFTPQSDPLRGMRSIGFGGAVLADDIDMLYESFFGVISNGIQELVYGLGLPRRLAEDARYGNQIRPHFGIAHGKTYKDTKYLQIILSYECPEDFIPTKAALSVNELRWIWANNPGNDLDDYDDTSRLLFDSGWLNDIISPPTESTDNVAPRKHHQ